ncbi:hypothetical protein TTHERM_00048930 (macronuclear) [Tetrahymena thermophila SB210]|uniref:Uncharacterized protein n=1 Tax=Tetrahymena thermophila (strain SB210) TaxID=312017 RepID=Q23D97_TETTS|nr:hypothetical protein TTHERM_00048930 [Tetrahymena thermophila SB210]EAR94484.1 hypothetical protein TTHERM_00048930 [Tetrahymena thermophila SB210]|eukprot:XP_001014789.1 hypothetical protein TTHERM_00048930 [Tetrahymena thermophila SB210]
MEIESESSSCISFGQQTKPLNPQDYYSNHTVTFGEDMSKFKQYHTPFNTFLQQNNINVNNQLPQQNSTTNLSQSSTLNSSQQNNPFQTNGQSISGVNIFSQQNNNLGMNNQNQQQPQNGFNIFAQNNAQNQGVNIFASQQSMTSQSSSQSGINIFQNIPQQQQQQPQNPFQRNVPLNQLASNLFPQVEVNYQSLIQTVAEQNEEGDGEYDPTENDEDGDEQDFEEKEQKEGEDDDDNSSGTSCDDIDQSELNDCINQVDDKSFNLQEYLRMRDQL